MLHSVSVSRSWGWSTITTTYRHICQIIVVSIYLLLIIVKISYNLVEIKYRYNVWKINILTIFAKISALEHIRIGTKKQLRIAAAVAAILSVCLLFLTIGSFIVNTNMQQQALAQIPDNSYTPHTGIIHQVPDRVTLSPLQP